MNLKNLTSVKIRQVKELAELFGFETRNKYTIESIGGDPIGFAAEQGKGLLGLLIRSYLGHWRTFEVHFFNDNREFQFKANHPFRWFFHRLEVFDSNDKHIGSLQQRFGVLTKKFDVLDSQDNEVGVMRSGFIRIWTFPITSNGIPLALITKKWGGLLKEAFLDADNFVLDFQYPSMNEDMRKVFLAAAIFVDLQYFEQKPKSNLLKDLID